jgi:hemerythrin-like metal-binding protein
MMRQLGYPKTAEHRELHIDLVKKLQAMSARAFEGDEQVLAFKQFVYDWVTDHIMTQDQDFFRFTREK